MRPCQRTHLVRNSLSVCDTLPYGTLDYSLPLKSSLIGQERRLCIARFEATRHRRYRPVRVSRMKRTNSLHITASVFSSPLKWDTELTFEGELVYIGSTGGAPWAWLGLARTTRRIRRSRPTSAHTGLSTGYDACVEKPYSTGYHSVNGIEHSRIEHLREARYVLCLCFKRMVRRQ